MQTCTLADPAPVERDLLKRLTGTEDMLTEWRTFPSGELFVHVRDVQDHVCVIGRTYPPGDHFFATQLLLDAVRRAGARHITLALPYFAYARQDKQRTLGDCLSGVFAAHMLAAAGAQRVVTVALHSDRVAKHSPIPIDSISLMPQFAAKLRSGLQNVEFTVVAPDNGSVKQAKKMAAELGSTKSVVWIEKDRRADGSVVARDIHGELVGTTAVIVDDVLDTGATMQGVVELLQSRGMRTCYMCVTHAIFSGDVVHLVERLQLDKVIASDTLLLDQSVLRIPNMSVVHAAQKMAQAIEMDS